MSASSPPVHVLNVSSVCCLLFSTHAELLADVQFIRYGPFSRRFEQYDVREGKPWLCFSLYLEHRTFDLECQNENQVGGMPHGQLDDTQPFVYMSDSLLPSLSISFI